MNVIYDIRGLKYKNYMINSMLALMFSHFSHVQLFVTLWTIACQAPLSLGFSRQEYWSGLPFLSPGSSRPRDPTETSHIADSLLFELSGEAPRWH